MKWLIVALVGALLLPFVLLIVATAAATAFATALAPTAGFPIAPGMVPLGPFPQTFGPMYFATIGGTPTIHDLGFGPSDAGRVERLIRSIKPTSPLVGTGETILHLGQQFNVDPLLIAQWQLESGMATVGANSPGNGGNMIWAAARPYAEEYGCGQGESFGGVRWARCPTVAGGLGIWFRYVSDFYPPRTSDLRGYANIYNPCSDPGNVALMLTCGDRYATLILALVRDHAGLPAEAPAPPVLPGGGCPAPLPITLAETNLILPATAAQIVTLVLGGRAFPVTQGWGPSSLTGEPTYLGIPHFHTGVDLGTPSGTPIYAPIAGIATPGTAGTALTESLRMANGATWNFLHLDRQVASGPVNRGSLLGFSGNTGYSTGPHLHVEMRDVRGKWIPPEQWVCYLV